jgi:hypothetical protein
LRTVVQQLGQAVERAEQDKVLGPVVRAQARQLATKVTRLGSRLLRMAEAGSDSRIAPNTPEPLLRVGNT